MSKDKTQNALDAMDKPLPLVVILLIPIYVIVIFSVILFPISKDWKWIEAWLFILTFASIFAVSYYVINQKNPRVIRNRMKVKKEGLTSLTKKSAGSDAFVLPFLGIGFVGALILPPFDHRLGWSSIPFLAEMIALVLTNTGILIMDIAMIQNAFASKVLDINQGQILIESGLYAHVRHPLYSGAILMILALPIALGSWWGLIPAAVGVLVLVVRIQFEEDMLVKGMEGYSAYRTRVKYKLLPKIY